MSCWVETSALCFDRPLQVCETVAIVGASESLIVGRSHDVHRRRQSLPG